LLLWLTRQAGHHPVHSPAATVRTRTGATRRSTADAQFRLAFETELTLSWLVFRVSWNVIPKLKVVSHHLGEAFRFFWGRTTESYDPEQQKAASAAMPGRSTTTSPSFTMIRPWVAALRPSDWPMRSSGRINWSLPQTRPSAGHRRKSAGDYPRAVNPWVCLRPKNRKIMGENARRILKLPSSDERPCCLA